LQLCLALAFSLLLAGEAVKFHRALKGKKRACVGEKFREAAGIVAGVVAEKTGCG